MPPNLITAAVPFVLTFVWAVILTLGACALFF